MKIDLGKLRGNPEAPLLALDLFMVLLVLFNLVWILFNTLFASQVVQAGVAWLSADFHAWYGTQIHPNFLDYDMLFVAVYVTELLFRWALAIVRRTYHRWFFYPFVRWYDVLGCIPVGSFRWLRVLRAVSLLWRLQKNGVIDLSQTWLVRTAGKYLDILTEEVADRVVVNVLDGVHGELARGNPVVHRIGREVLAPRRDELLDWLTSRLRDAGSRTWQAQRAALHDYLSPAIAEGLEASAEVRRLQAIPLVGPAVKDALDAAITDIARGIIERIANDLSDPAGERQLRNTLASVVDALTEDDERLAVLMREALLETLLIVKQQVSVQQWKVREAEGFYD